MTIIDRSTKAFALLLESKHWKLKLTLALVVFSLFFATPSLRMIIDSPTDIGWQTVMKQRDANGIHQPDAPPMSQAAKKTFRIAVPLVAKVLHLNVYGIYILQVLIGVLFIFLVMVFVQRETSDKFIAALFGICFATLFVGRACFTDVYSRFEGWCYFFLFLTIFFQRGWLVFLFAFLACWTDERAILGLGNVFLWWIYKEHGFDKISLNASLLQRKYMIVVYAILSYIVIRVLLQFQFGYYIPSSGIGLVYILRGFRYFNLGTWLLLEGLWLVVLYFIYLMFQHRRNIFLALFLFVNGFIALSAFIVFDVTRSGSFSFIAAFIALVGVQQMAPVKLRELMKYAALLCLLFPPYYIILDINPYVLQFESVPIQMIKLLKLQP